MSCSGLNQIVSLNVPSTDNTFGTMLDVSSLSGTKSVILSGTYTGKFIVFGSHNGTNFVPILTFDSGIAVQQAKLTFDYVLKYLKVKREAQVSSPVSISVAAQAVCSTNQFISLPTLTRGSQGPQPSVDLFSLVPATGLNPGSTFIANGNFSGVIALEGSLDNISFSPIGNDADGRSVGGFQSSPSPDLISPLLSPVVSDEIVRYIRLNVTKNSFVYSPVTVTLGAGKNNDCSSSGSGDGHVANVTALRALAPRASGDSVYLQGYHDRGDGGAGTFYAGPVATDNGGTIFSSGDATLSWYRDFENNSEFCLDWFGAKNDGYSAIPAYGIGGVMTAGSPDVGVTGYTFTSADIGKLVILFGAGVDGATLVGTVIGLSATPGWAVLNVNASTTVASTECHVGTDNTPAFNACSAVVAQANSQSSPSPNTIGWGGTIKLGSGDYVFGSTITYPTSTNLAIIGDDAGDVQNQNTTITTASFSTGVLIPIPSGVLGRARLENVRIYGHPSMTDACFKTMRSYTQFKNIRTDFGFFGIRISEGRTIRGTSFYCYRAVSHGVQTDTASNELWLTDFQSTRCGGHGLRSMNGAINFFRGDLSSNALAGYRISSSQTVLIESYFEAGVSGDSGTPGIIDEDCIDVREGTVWRGSIYSVIDNGCQSQTYDTQGNRASGNLYHSGKLTNLQQDSEFRSSTGGFTNAGTPCTVANDSSIGLLGGTSLRVRTNLAVVTPTLVNASRSLAISLDVGETVVVRCWARASKPMFYNSFSDPNQTYFTIAVNNDGLQVPDYAFTPYIDNTTWRPCVLVFRQTTASSVGVNFNLQIVNALGNGASQDTVWITGLELYILPDTDSSDDSAFQGKDVGKIPYIRTFQNETQTASLGAMSQLPVVATANIPSASPGLNNSLLIENKSTSLGLVAYGNGLRASVPSVLTGSAVLDFPIITTLAQAELTISVTGAVVGNPISLAPPASLEAGLSALGYVSAADTVTVRLLNCTSLSINPASATWSVKVFQ